MSGRNKEGESVRAKVDASPTIRRTSREARVLNDSGPLVSQNFDQRFVYCRQTICYYLPILHIREQPLILFCKQALSLVSYDVCCVYDAETQMQ